MRIVDAHHHLWDLDTNDYPWLKFNIRNVVFGDYAGIRRNYLISDFRSDIGNLPVEKSVHVQADWAAHDPVGETRWLQSVALSAEAKGLPHAIVAFADLSSPHAAGVLDAHAMFPNLRGIRQMLHHARLNDRSVSRRELLWDSTWLANLDLLRQRGLSFDLQLFPEQMPRAADVVAANPQVQFMLTHTGSPLRRDVDGVRGWRHGMTLLSRNANLAVKISGLGMYDLKWTTDSIRYFVRTTIDVFGPSRCMFGSNFPVDGLMSSYSAVWDAFAAITCDLPEVDCANLFAGNAERYYRI